MAKRPSTEQTLDFSGFPPIYVLQTHLDEDELDDIYDKLEEFGAPQTYDMTEAKLVLGRVTTKRRAMFELRCRKLWTEQIDSLGVKGFSPEKSQEVTVPISKRRKVDPPESKPGDTNAIITIDDSSTESEVEEYARARPEPASKASKSRSATSSPEVSKSGSTKPESLDVTQSATQSDTSQQKITDQPDPRPVAITPVSDTRNPSPERLRLASLSESIKVIKDAWLYDSVKHGVFQSLGSYLVYEGKKIDRPPGAVAPTPPPQPKRTVRAAAPKPQAPPQAKLPRIPEANRAILERAKADMEAILAKQNRGQFNPAQQFKDATFSSQSQRRPYPLSTTQTPHLLQKTTSEYESGEASDIPEMPDWVKQHQKYACQRSTPSPSPNCPFISELKKIKTARLLTADEVGVRAYSTSIAALAAYPYPFTSPKEIVMLPGCDAKIANLWVEFKNTGKIEAAEDAENDEALTVLRLFYDIWGVGATTAREFYYERGWRDLDDVVEFGWSTLNREQQIGVKYYDEFLQGIPRPEVESIAKVIDAHAVRVRDNKIQSLVVGGYRRGKDKSGDVDIIIAHPDPEKTLGVVHEIVASLEQEGWITHTLQLKLTNTHRGQNTLPYRTGGGGHGFDSLDKALVVWQNPEWPTKRQDLKDNPKAKNPNPHRRVDIIISPWRTVGCAVVGWSGGTTFQRDLRRYAKHVKGWKFDSSGVRDRYTGHVVELEKVGGVPKTMVEAEKKVFEGLGLAYREPWERCTG
ncbi:MAG: hypothetical protein M1820_004729 [Bogoriella megaspora]|nr:MAG: hypothetical protein M1820_004729 [Bogoriella megaspora]